MQNLITSFLLQNRQALLPGIGLFRMVVKPAVIGKANNTILPPADVCTFSEDSSHFAHDLIKYIARKKNLSIITAEEELEKFCQTSKQEINSGGELHFPTLGYLQKNEERIVFFKEENNIQYLKQVNVKIFQEVAIPELAGDVVKNNLNEDIPLESNKFHNIEISGTRYPWFKWSIIVCAVAIVVLLFRYYVSPASTNRTGNQSHFSLSSPGSTYLIPEK